VLSDIQPKKRKRRREFERAIQDINQNVRGIDFAIVAGDILQEVNEEDLIGIFGREICLI